MADYEEKLTSEYNEAGFQISRLHNIWLECKYLREKGRLILYKWKLDGATIELWNDANRLDKDEDDKKDGWIVKLKKLDEDIADSQKKKDFDALYLKLIEKEKLLRSIQEKSGKGAKYRPADDDYM